MKIINLTEEEFDQFSKNHKYRTIYQTSSYGKLMAQNGFESYYLGFQNNQGTLVGATLILYRKAFLNYRYAYCPSGYLIDYTDPDFLMELTQKLRKFLYHNHFIFLKIDPPIPCSERKEDGSILSYNPEMNSILKNLEDCGYQHTGFNLFFENTKARWNAVLKLHASNAKLYQGLEKQVRNKIKKADKSGILIYQAPKEDLPQFYEFIKKKHYRTLEYYQQLMDAYGEDAELYLAKIDPYKYVQKSKESYEKVLEENEYLTRKMQDKSIKGKSIRRIMNRKMESDRILGMDQASLHRSTKLFQTNPEGIVVGGAIILKMGNEIDLLIEGFDKKYSSFNPNYYLKWELIQKFNKENYQYFNMNAIVGEFKKKNKYSGLNEMKFGYGAVGVEYIGEFNYIINPIAYQLYLKKNVKKNTKN